MRAFTWKHGSRVKKREAVKGVLSVQPIPKIPHSRSVDSRYTPLLSLSVVVDLFIYLFPLILYLSYLDVIKGSLSGGGGAECQRWRHSTNLFLYPWQQHIPLLISILLLLITFRATVDILTSFISSLRKKPPCRCCTSRVNAQVKLSELNNTPLVTTRVMIAIKMPQAFCKWDVEKCCGVHMWRRERPSRRGEALEVGAWCLMLQTVKVVFRFQLTSGRRRSWFCLDKSVCRNWFAPNCIWYIVVWKIRAVVPNTLWLVYRIILDMFQLSHLPWTQNF